MKVVNNDYICTVRTMLHLSSDSVFIFDQNGIIEMVNSVAIETLRLTQDNIIGTNISELIGDQYLPLNINGDGVKDIESNDILVEKKQVQVKIRTGCDYQQSQLCPFLLSIADIKIQSSGDYHTKYCAFLKEVASTNFISKNIPTMKKEQTNKRIGSDKNKCRPQDHSTENDFLNEIVESSPHAAFIINNDGIIRSVSELAIKQFGWTEKELLGSSVYRIIPKCSKKNEYAYKILFFENVEENNYFVRKTFKIRVYGKDNKEFFSELSIIELQNQKGQERLFCVHSRDLTQQRNQESRIWQSQSEASFDALFHINETGIIQMVNEAAVKNFGWTREEFIGSNISMIVGKEHADKHDEYIARYLKTGEKRVMGKARDLPAKRKDGSQFFIELGLTEILTEDGDERMFCGFVRDITKRKEYEQEILRKQRLTMGIFDASFDALFHINEKGVIQMVNQAATKNFGWTREELIGSNISIIVGKEHADKHDEYIARYLKTGEKRVMGKMRELPAKRKDGSQFFIELGLTEILTDDGDERMFCGFVRDITKRKQDQLEIQRKQRLTMGIIEASFDALFNINENGIIQMVNEAAVKKFGWTREEFIGRNISMIVGKEHADKHDEYIARYLKTGEKRVMGKTRKLPAKRKDGSQFLIELGLTEILTEDGEERIFCGFVRDITKRTQYEEELLRRERLNYGILEASLDALFTINQNGIIQVVNEAATKQFGWTREELIGQNIKLIVGGGHAANHNDYLARYYKTGEKRVIGKKRELIARRKDGSEFPIELGLSEVNVDGDERIFCGFLRDLTQEKMLIKTEIEKSSAETLLLNMLPENISTRFQGDASSISDHFAATTILFADIAGYEELSGKSSPINSSRILNDLFRRFDELLDKYHLNKVKTIGSCYTVSSIPEPDQEDDSCVIMCTFSLNLIKEMHAFNVENPGVDLNLRVGINTGIAVAGKLGKTRFLYDLWGDAVNIASRMETTSVPGKIQVTKDVVKHAEHVFNFEPRGTISVKGKGNVETFFLVDSK